MMVETCMMILMLFLGRGYCLFVSWSHDFCLILYLAIPVLSIVQNMCGNTVYKTPNVHITTIIAIPSLLISVQ